MSVTAFVNELSLNQRYQSAAEGAAAMKRLVSVLQALRSRAGSIALQLPEPLNRLILAENFSVPVWLNSGDHKDEWRFLLALQNRSPHGFGLDNYANSILGCDFYCEGKLAIGLGWAAFTEGLAISIFPRDNPWDVSAVALRCEELIEDDHTGALTVRSSDVSVRHALDVEHVQAHADWLLGRLNSIAPDGRALWTERATLFPNLAFLPRVEDQISRLPAASPTLKEVRNRLHEINDSIRGWKPAQEAMPEWKSKVTPEGETRRKLCNFSNEQGITACYDLHARFTPGSGRIHFLLNSNPPTATIAHIGDKL